MFIAVYWWRIEPGKEEQFRAAWRRATELIAARYGSCGSRLHRDRDGRFVGYAQWPDHDTWRRAFDARMEASDPEVRRLFSESVAEAPPDGAPVFELEVTDDLLLR